MIWLEYGGVTLMGRLGKDNKDLELQFSAAVAKVVIVELQFNAAVVLL